MSDLPSIILDLFRRAGIPADGVDVSRLDDRIGGIVLSQRQSIRTALDHLQMLFQFDCLENNRALTFVPRGARDIIAITEDELLPKSGNRSGNRDLAIVRKPDEQLPQQLNIVYYDKDSDHLPASQSALYQLNDNSTSATVPAVVSISANQAKTQADMLLDTSWQERFRFSMAVLPKYQYLEPGDLVNLVLSNQNWLIRLTRTMFQQGFVRLEGVSIDPETYNQQSIGAKWNKTQSVAPPSQSFIEFLDGAFDDGLTQTPLYFSAIRRTSGDSKWGGAFLYESNDNINYTPVDTVNSTAHMGIVTVLPNTFSPTAFFDDASIITVVLYDGMLTSISDTELLNGGNSALIGDEIIQFGNATLIATNTYKLSHLLRGRRGTEGQMNTHVVNERFVLLDNFFPRTNNLSGNNIGKNLWLKAVTSNTAITSANAKNVVPMAKNLRPLSPVHLNAKLQSNGDRLFTWIRRSRAMLPWQDYVDMPLSETTELYLVTISKNNTDLRQATVSTPSYTYLLSNQITDGVIASDVLTIKIAQISERVGAGYEGILVC